MKKLILGVLLLGACGQPESTMVARVAVWSDGAVSGEAISGGCEAWTAIGVPCSQAADRSEADLLITGFADNSPSAALGHEYPYTFPLQATVNVAWPQNAAMLQTTVAHEIGHALGMRHTDAGPAVMNTSAGTYHYNRPVLTDVDMAEWQALDH